MIQELFNTPIFWVVVIVSLFWFIPLVIVFIRYNQGFPSYRSLSQYGLSKIAKFGVTASGFAISYMFSDRVYSLFTYIAGSELGFLGNLTKDVTVVVFATVIVMILNWYISKLEERGRIKERREKEGRALLHSPTFMPRDY